MATSKEKLDEKRDVLVEGLKERGYNANLMQADDWDDEGYYMTVLDSKGQRMGRVWQEWDDPEHYEFVRDWFEEEDVD